MIEYLLKSGFYKALFLGLTLTFIAQMGVAQTNIARWGFDGVTISNTGQIPIISDGSSIADAGLQTAGSSFTGGHASSTTVWSNPAGNGSAKAVSSNTWGVGDYYQFQVNTTGYTGIKITVDQTGSNTGPANFKIQTSTNGSSFTDAPGATYTIINDTWSATGAGKATSTRTFDLGAVTSINNVPAAYIRVVVTDIASINGGTVAIGGTSRIDNFVVGGTAGSNPVEEVKLSPLQLSFLVNRMNDTSAVMSYLLKGPKQASVLRVSPSVHFLVSADSSGIYKDSVVMNTDSVAIAKGIKVFVRYNPKLVGPHTGTVRNVLGSTTLTLDVSGSITDAFTTTVSAIQGKAPNSTMVGQNVIVEAVVSADLQLATEQKGFYMQDIHTSDSDTLTSEGIFVFDNLSGFDVQERDRVRVTGKVAETFGQTNISSVTAISIISKNNFVTSNLMKLPADSIDRERFEGMKVRINQTLTVTETYLLGRYGELSVSVDGRLYNPTNFIDPNDNPKDGNTSIGFSNIGEVSAQQILNKNRKVILCDPFSIQNPNPVPFIDPITKTLRSGTTIDTLIGVMGYDFGNFKIYPSELPKFNYALRPVTPVLPASDVKVVGTNVLNYFNGDGMGGGFPTPRGAATLPEFKRQRAKIVATLKALDADVVGLMEMENDSDGLNSAIKDLVDSLNAAYGSTAYDYIRDPSGANGNPGTDQIKVAFIFKPAIVSPQGLARSYNDVAFDGIGRPPLAQTFIIKHNSEKFTAIVNHFKSKGCAATAPEDPNDNDMLDGQGCFNATRKKQATALLTFISSIIQQTGNSNVISVGDYNAYEQEDPIDILRAGGLVSLVENSYSYVFEGQAGSLDHGFVTPDMYKNLTGAVKWHSNADEPTIIDYTLSFKTQDLYTPVAYRSSDHDPLLAGFKWEFPLSLNKESSLRNSLSIYPNPTNGSIVTFSKNISATLFNSEGGKVTILVNAGQLDITNFAPGVYYLVAEGYRTEKVVVIR